MKTTLWRSCAEADYQPLRTSLAQRGSKFARGELVLLNARVTGISQESSRELHGILNRVVHVVVPEHPRSASEMEVVILSERLSGSL